MKSQTNVYYYSYVLSKDLDTFVLVSDRCSHFEDVLMSSPIPIPTRILNGERLAGCWKEIEYLALRLNYFAGAFSCSLDARLVKGINVDNWRKGRQPFKQGDQHPT